MLKIAKKIVYLQKIASACRVSKAQRVFNKYAWLCKYGAGPSPIEGMPNELSNPSPQPYVPSPATEAMNANTMATSRQFQQNMKRQRNNYLLNRQHRQQSARNAQMKPMPGRDYQLPSARNIRTRLYQENPNYQPYDPYKYDRAPEQVDLDFNAVPPDPAQKQRDNYLLNSQRRQQSAKNSQTQPMPGRDYALPAARNIRTRLYPENANYQAYDPEGNGGPVDLNLAAVPPDGDQVMDMSYMDKTPQQLYQDAYANGELDQEAIDLYNQRYPDAPLGPDFNIDEMDLSSEELPSPPGYGNTTGNQIPMPDLPITLPPNLPLMANPNATQAPTMQMNSGYANGVTPEPDYPDYSRYTMQGAGPDIASPPSPYEAVPPGTKTAPQLANSKKKRRNGGRVPATQAAGGQSTGQQGGGRGRGIEAPATRAAGGSQGETFASKSVPATTGTPVTNSPAQQSDGARYGANSQAVQSQQAGSPVSSRNASDREFFNGLTANQQALWKGYAHATHQVGTYPTSSSDMQRAQLHYRTYGMRPGIKRFYNAQKYYGGDF